MKTKNFPLLIVLILLTSCKQTKIERQPNIIYILADDLGYGDLGCYGQVKIETPNIDKLAAQGMLMTQHYAGSTVCAPSRSALMTGLHTGHTFIRGNAEIQPEGQKPMPQEAFTIAELLKKADYTTGAFGKWGLGMNNTEGDPNNQGFDVFFGYLCQRLAHRYFPDYLWYNGKKVILEGNRYKYKNVYASDVIHKKALEFITSNKDKPFFLFYPNVAPHAEIVIPEGKHIDKYRGKFEEKPFINEQPGANYGDEDFNVQKYCTQLEPHATFAAMVSLLDEQVGDIMAKVEELDLEENTIIIFTSDNGPHNEGGADPNFFNSAAGLRGQKRDLYEGGIRVPMIVKWNNHIEAGTTSDHISAFWDMMPTLADLANTESPKCDGLSMLPTWLGRKGQEEHTHLYWEFHERDGRQAIRKGDWKLVKLHCFSPTKTTFELYNIKNDPGETNNLIQQEPAIVTDLVTLLKQEHTYNAMFPFTNLDKQ